MCKKYISQMLHLNNILIHYYYHNNYKFHYHHGQYNLLEVLLKRKYLIIILKEDYLFLKGILNMIIHLYLKLNTQLYLIHFQEYMKMLKHMPIHSNNKLIHIKSNQIHLFNKQCNFQVMSPLHFFQYKYYCLNNEQIYNINILLKSYKYYNSKHHQIQVRIIQKKYPNRNYFCKLMILCSNNQQSKYNHLCKFCNHNSSNQLLQYYLYHINKQYCLLQYNLDQEFKCIKLMQFDLITYNHLCIKYINYQHNEHNFKCLNQKCIDYLNL